jgi:predicted porin
MKKSLIVLAALTGFAGVASAQSSVTLFGIADLAARSVKNGIGSVQGLSHSGSASTRLGLRGVEDLGGGMRAGFWLEGTLSLDDGNPGGQNWQRRSTISLSGSFGEIRLGRDYTPDFWNHTVFDPFATAGVGNSVNVFGSSNGTDIVRANNSIGYFLPNMGGLYGQVMIAAGEGESGRKHTGFRIGYAAGPVNVAFSMGKNTTGVTVAERAAANSSTVINPSFRSEAGYTRMNLGGSYRIDKSTLMFQYNRGKSSGAWTADEGFSTTQILVGGRFAVGDGILKASYIRSDGKGGFARRSLTASDAWVSRDSQDATQIALGYEQPLSRRTALFANYAQISNKAMASYSMAGGATPRAAVPGAPAGSCEAQRPLCDLNRLRGSKVTGYEFGMRHSF